MSTSSGALPLSRYELLMSSVLALRRTLEAYAPHSNSPLLNLAEDLQNFTVEI